MTTQRVPKKISALAAGALFASGTLLAGCSGASTAQEPQAPASATETPEPAAPFEIPAEPVLPNAAKLPTEAGAQAFIQYYFEVISWSYAAQRVDVLRSLGDPQYCESCDNFINDIGEMTAAGQRSSGALRTITSWDLIKEKEGPAFLFKVKYDQAPETVYAPTGEITKTGTGSAGQEVNVGADWRETRWVIVSLFKDEE